MPSTLPLNEPVARKDSTRGTRIENVSLLPFRLPIVNSENEAGLLVLYSASAAAIFIGCCLVMILPWMSPEIAVTDRGDET